MSRERRLRILAELAASGPGDLTPAHLCEVSRKIVAVSGAGIILFSGDIPVGSVCTASAVSALVEELQYTLGEGPCVDASRTGRPVLQPDLARTAPGRWPAFASGAIAAGLCAVFAFPLRVGAIRVGVLDLYRDVVGVLSPAELTEALSFADAATALMLQLQAQAAGTDLPLDSLAVLDDRAEVHQATGVISVHAGVGLGEALVLLRARAYAEQRPIGDLARNVLDGEVHFRPDMDE